MTTSFHSPDNAGVHSPSGELAKDAPPRHDGESSLECAAPAPPAAPLRVLVVRSVSGSGGGAEKIILRTRSACEARGIQLTVCAIHAAKDQEFDFLQRADRVNLEVHAVRQRWPGDPAVIRRLAAIASTQQFDLIHSHDYKANFYALKLARRFKLPTVSTAHGWTGHRWRERGFYYPLDKRLLRGFDAVIGVSSEISAELAECGVRPSRISTLLNGVDPSKYRPDSLVRSTVRTELGYREGDVVIGSVGRAEKQKRFDLLIEAFAELAAKRPELRLVIVGAGSLVPSLRELADRKGVGDRCQLLGHRSDMLAIYQALDVYVQSSEYEGTPTVLLEAMAMGLPLVATNVGGTTELATHELHALIVPPHNVQAISQAVLEVIEVPAAAQLRAARARVRIESELSIDHRTAQLATIYATAVAGHQRR